MSIKLSNQLKEQFASFLDVHPPQPFSAALRSLLLQYMAAHVQEGLPVHFDTFLSAMDDLFRLLDNAAAAMQKQTPTRQDPSG